jgi:hypothetical protein
VDTIGSGCEPDEVFREYGNDPLGSIKYGKFLDSLKNYQLLKEDCAPWSFLDSENYKQTVSTVEWLGLQDFSVQISAQSRLS